MLSDRPYMQRGIPFPTSSVVIQLIIANVAIFILQNILHTAFSSVALEKFFALSPATFFSGYIWTLITYSFLHGSLIHILFNMLVLYFIGKHVEPVLGSRRFLGLYFASVICGGLFWLLFHWNTPGLVVGASAASIGTLICFCALYPNQQITFLLFFVLPVTLKPKWLAAIVIGIESFGFLFNELSGRGSSPVAYSAHLGGALGGYLYFTLAVRKNFSLSSFFPSRVKIEKPAWLKKKAPERKFTINFSEKPPS